MMEKEFNIVYEEKPEEAAWGIIGEGLYHFNTKQYGESAEKRLCFVLESPAGEIVGGILGMTYWEWFNVDLLWVKEELRSQQYGHRLLVTAEAEAKKRGAKHAYLDTFSFQVPEFYQQHGYEVFGELKDFPPGHQRYFFQKEL